MSDVRRENLKKLIATCEYHINVDNANTRSRLLRHKSLSWEELNDWLEHRKFLDGQLASLQNELKNLEDIASKRALLEQKVAIAKRRVKYIKARIDIECDLNGMPVGGNAEWRERWRLAIRRADILQKELDDLNKAQKDNNDDAIDDVEFDIFLKATLYYCFAEK